MSNPVKEAIVLAGEPVSPLQHENGEIPKAMVSINGKPFLNYLLSFLRKNGITNVLLAVGYKHEMIRAAFGDSFEGMKITYAVEKEPLDTGGGIKLALENTEADVLFVFSCDTFLDINLAELSQFHFEKKSTCSVALTKLHGSNRAGVIELNEDEKIISFKNKQSVNDSIVNTGVYCINKGVLIHYPVNTPFSFEKNYLENNPKAKNIFGKIFDAYFVDLSVAEDCQKFAMDTLK